MTTTEIKTVERTWPSLAALLYVPHSESEYNRLVEMLDSLIDTVGENENHSLASLLEVIGVLVEKYEDDNVTEIAAA